MLRYEKGLIHCCAKQMTEAQDFGSFVAVLNGVLMQQAIARKKEPNSLAENVQPQYGNFKIGSPHHRNKSITIRRGSPRRTAELLRVLKQCTRCFKCGNQRHRCAEYPGKTLFMSDAIAAPLQPQRSNRIILHNTLLAIAYDYDEFNYYLIDLEREQV